MIRRKTRITRRRNLSGAARILGTLLFLGAAPLRAEDNPLGLHVHHVTASVADIDRAIRWYRQVLGFRLVERGSRANGELQFAELSIPGFGIGLVQLPSDSKEEHAAAAANTPAWLHVVFSVDDPDETFDRLRQRGGDAFTRPADSKRPVSSFLLHDSEGNEIEIVGRARSRGH